MNRGINEARDVLLSSGSLSDAESERIDETKQLIFNGLDKLIDVDNAESHDDNISSAGIQTSVFSASEQSSRQASIQIETLDGDQVSIDVSSFSSASFTQGNASTDNVTLSAFRKSNEYNF